MDSTDAGGRNTQAQTALGTASLETDLQDTAVAIAALLADARAIDSERDEYGHARSRAYDNAVALLKVSAKLGHSIAALRGSKFEHNINVRRRDVRGNSSAEEDETEESGWMWLGEETLFDWKNKRTYKLEKPKTAAAAVFEGAPHPISEGSNGNFDDPEAAGPKVRSL